MGVWSCLGKAGQTPTTMKLTTAVVAFAAAGLSAVRATPNSVPFQDCTSSQTLADSRYDPAERINVTNVYAQIADVNDGNGEQLRLSFLADTGKELVGFNNMTNYSSEYWSSKRSEPCLIDA
jgi:hypothetical protein